MQTTHRRTYLDDVCTRTLSSKPFLCLPSVSPPSSLPREQTPPTLYPFPFLASVQVTTPVLSWDRDVDGGDRPLSSVTMGVIATAAGDATATGEVGGVSGQELTEPSQNQSRPSSAAFQRWLKARPGARSAISAISSARMLGMDDPELVHLQVEMESRRGVMSETTLAQVGVFDIYIHMYILYVYKYTKLSKGYSFNETN